MDLLAGYGTAAIIAALVAAFGSAFVRGLTGFGMAPAVPILLALRRWTVLLDNFLSVFIGLSEIRRLLRVERSAWRSRCRCATPVGCSLGRHADCPRDHRLHRSVGLRRHPPAPAGAGARHDGGVGY